PPQQQPVMDRSGATFQTYPIPHPNANPCFRIFIGGKIIPTSSAVLKGPARFGLRLGVLAARGNQLFAVSPAAT
ncbi:hypothetical protein, partial [Pseudarthrobacter sp. fls2-241-R2A-168]|uniref:hypothetical protein n=1 Tax=Pseudarthrobacter sp. fls2-241-R2A-168 TaxID=3040304 RepID=UPI002555AE4E